MQWSPALPIGMEWEGGEGGEVGYKGLVGWRGLERGSLNISLTKA